MWQPHIGLGCTQLLLSNFKFWSIFQFGLWWNLFNGGKQKVVFRASFSNFKKEDLTFFVLLLRTWTLVLWKVVEMWLTSWWVTVSLSRPTKISHLFLHLFGSNFHFILTRYEGFEEHQEHFNNHQENQQQSPKNNDKVNYKLPTNGQVLRCGVLVLTRGEDWDEQQ